MQLLKRLPCGENRRPFSIVLAILLGIFLGNISGCSCWKGQAAKSKTSQTEDEIEKRRKELEAKKAKEEPDFESELVVLPSDDSPSRNQVKPGHWFNAVQQTKANRYEFPVGELEALGVDNRMQPISLPGTEFDFYSTRQVSLPKGQVKHFDLLCFANKPPRSAMVLETRLRPRGGGRIVSMKSEPTTTLRPFQNYMVVLAERPDSYQFVKALRSIKPERESEEFSISGNLEDYLVKLPKGGQNRIDLATHPMTWTSTAYVLWDDFNPSILTYAQQQSLIDWLHWGGQIIISGPRTLDLLSGTAMAPFLPAKSVEIGELGASQIETLNAHWSFGTEPERKLALGEEKPPLALKLQLQPEGQFVPNTADLVAEIRVGRGRVVATAFSLPHPLFLRWEGFDSFFNACILRRPPRFFYVREGLILERFVDAGLSRDDPRHCSQVRYFARDAMGDLWRREQGDSRSSRLSLLSTAPNSTSDQIPYGIPRYGPVAPVAVAANNSNRGDEVISGEAEVGIDDTIDTTETEDEKSREDGDEASWRSAPPAILDNTFGYVGFAEDNLMGVAGWSDRSDVSQAASEALRDAAGINVPDSRFVAQVLGLYLFILVPLNWLIFRLLGRVEWAWIAVPIIAVIGAWTVVRVAQLDIGFARAVTDIGVVEMQEGYERAHVTRYLGIYTSLSSQYELKSGNPTTLAQPMAQGTTNQRSPRSIGLFQGNEIELTGFFVRSASTEMVHTEQMIDFGGSLQLTRGPESETVANDTNQNLHGVIVLRRPSTDPTTVEFTVVGDLPAKSQRPLTFQPLKSIRESLAVWEESVGTRREGIDGELNIRALLTIAADPYRLGKGETTLIGWNDARLPELDLSPTAAQFTSRNVFLATLVHAESPLPKQDKNSFAELKKSEAAKPTASENDFSFTN